MAVKNNQVLKINLRKNENDKSPVYGKWFAEVDNVSTLSTRGLARHILSHNTVYGLDTIIGVLTLLSTCVPELVSQGIGVKLDGLGIFYASAESKGVTDPRQFSPQTDIKGIHVRFRPESTELDNITSRAFKKQCAIEMAYVLDPYTSTTGNRRFKKVPFSEYGSQAPAAAGGE